MGKRKLQGLLILLSILTVRAVEPEQFAVSIVKPYDVKITPQSGCFVGPGTLQYNCGGEVAVLVTQALDLPYCRVDYLPRRPMYSIIGKVAKPTSRLQMNEMMLNVLREKMGVRYHFEKRPIKAWFLNVASQELLKKLPFTDEPLPLSKEYTHLSFGAVFPPLDQFIAPSYPAGSRYYVVGVRNANFAMFVNILSWHCKCEVVDETGVSGRFNLVLSDIPIVRRDDENAGDGMAEVAQILKKYGISLQARKGFVDVMVVDSVGDEARFLN